jgi:Reverse transcriptase (RNA-dependent DNA polymerase)
LLGITPPRTQELCTTRRCLRDKASWLEHALYCFVLAIANVELTRRGHRFARYADDMIILVKSTRAAERLMRSITRYLESVLKVKVNALKSKVAPMSECSFLGFTIQRNQIRWTAKSLARFGPSQRTHGSKLGRIDGEPFAKAWAIRAGLDGVLRHQPVLLFLRTLESIRDVGFGCSYKRYGSKKARLGFSFSAWRHEDPSRNDDCFIGC